LSGQGIRKKTRKGRKIQMSNKVNDNPKISIVEDPVYRNSFMAKMTREFFKSGNYGFVGSVMDKDQESTECILPMNEMSEKEIKNFRKENNISENQRLRSHRYICYDTKGGTGKEFKKSIDSIFYQVESGARWALLDEDSINKNDFENGKIISDKNKIRIQANLEVIGSRLSKICRFCGNTEGNFWPVSTHSILVAMLVSEIVDGESNLRKKLFETNDFKEFAAGLKALAPVYPPKPWITNQKRSMLATVLCALIHDAAEIFIGDIPRPVKDLAPQIKLLEKEIMKEILIKFDLWTYFIYFEPVIKAADNLALAIEKYYILNCDDEWNSIEGVGLSRELIDEAFTNGPRKDFIVGCVYGSIETHSSVFHQSIWNKFYFNLMIYENFGLDFFWS
jgi:hypothetical protein